MSSPYELFSTDGNKETKGIVLDYGDFSITIARAGGSNRKYQKTLEVLSKPIRRALMAGQADPKRVTAIMQEVFATAVVLDWKGVKDKAGKALPFNKENCIQLFKDLPDFFADIQDQASSLNLFREADIAGDSKN